MHFNTPTNEDNKMNDYTLNKAMKLKEDRDQAYKHMNKAYNKHMYLTIKLDGVDVTGLIDTDEIGKMIETQFRAKGERLDQELKDL